MAVMAMTQNYMIDCIQSCFQIKEDGDHGIPIDMPRREYVVKETPAGSETSLVPTHTSFKTSEI